MLHEHADVEESGNLTVFSLRIIFTFVQLWVFFPSCLSKGSGFGNKVFHHGVELLQAEVCLPGGPGAADNLTGAHNALLPHPEGLGPPLLGLLGCGVCWGAEGFHLHPLGFQRQRWVSRRCVRFCPSGSDFITTRLHLSARFQCKADEPTPEGGDSEQTSGDHEAGHPCRDLHAAEQSALRRLVQPGWSHLSGDTQIWVCNKALTSPAVPYVFFSCCASRRSRTSWRFLPPRYSPSSCWGRSWVSISGSPFSSSWLESL